MIEEGNVRIVPPCAWRFVLCLVSSRCAVAHGSTVSHARGTQFIRRRRRFHGEISLKWGWSIADCLDGSFERVRALFNARHRRIASAEQIGGRR